MTYEQLRDITNRRNNLDLAEECEYLKRTSPRETSNTGTCTLTALRRTAGKERRAGEKP